MKNIKQLSDESFDDVCKFIINLGEKIHGYGPNAPRLEWYLDRVTKIYGYHGVFRSTPDQISFAFSKDASEWQNIHISAMDGTGTELNRMAAVGDLISELEKGTVSIKEATTRLDEIDKLKHPWGNTANAIAYIICGAAFPILLGGGWWDMILSGVFGLVVFFMVINSGKWGPLSGEWLPFSTAFVAGILAGIARFYLPEINVVLVVLSSVLILIPGYGISVGIIEIVSKHINSGLSNLVTGLIYLFKQFFGGWLGFKAVALVLTLPAAVEATPISSTWLWLGVPLIIISLGIALQTPFKDFLWACIGMVIAFLGTVYGSDWVSVNFGNLLGMVFLVVFTNIWSRKTHRPPSIVLVPAFILLVSGSIGFRGLSAFAAGSIQTGIQEFSQMFIVALTLAAGLVIGVTLSNPNKKLGS